MESKLRGVKAIVEIQDELCWISKMELNKWQTSINR